MPRWNDMRGRKTREDRQRIAQEVAEVERRVIERKGESLCECDSPLASLVRSVLFIMRGNLFTRRISI